MIKLEVGPQGEEFEFLVDTGEDITCVLKVPIGCKLSEKNYKVKGAKAELYEVKIIEEVVIKGNLREGYCNLLYMPRLGCNLLGRDLQVQLGVGVIPQEGRMVAKVMLMREEDESEIEGGVWAEEGNRGLLDILPIKVEMATGIPPE